MKCRNSTNAFIYGLQELLSDGQRIAVRGAEVLELRNRVIEIERPTERCIILPRRNNNIFASIAETIWLLAGRGDLAFLTHYLPRAEEFSDDGNTWRAAYGPRLRNWYGIDQIQQSLVLLQQDLASRRAVMSIFDPASDFKESKDIPCNNWIHWLVRDDALHMNVAIRSNDIMWGFSGINAFEWSILQELMAYWLGVAVGRMTFFVSSFHLYQRHERRAQLILNHLPEATCYETGVAPLSFQTPYVDFDGIVREWLAIEADTRIAPDRLDARIRALHDPLLRHFLELIQIFNGAHVGWDRAEIDARLAELPPTDLTAAAYEYFHRDRAHAPTDIPQAGLAHFWTAFHRLSEDRDGSDSEAICEAITQLHAAKTEAYGNSWKRRGEQISILSNIARKVDRLERIASGASAPRNETLLDTAIDLFVYCIKYKTYLADIDNEVAMTITELSAMAPPYSDGLLAFDRLVRAVDFDHYVVDTSVREAASQAITRFQDLEACFPALARVLSVRTRMNRLERLVAASVHLIIAIRHHSPQLYRDFLFTARYNASSQYCSTEKLLLK